MTSAATHFERIEEARKCLYAAALMADSFDKPRSAEAFRAASEALDVSVCTRLGHDTTEMLWPGTAHQGVICYRCGEFLPC